MTDEQSTPTPITDPPAPLTPTQEVLQFFKYEHLPPHLQAVSKPFCDLARLVVAADGVELTGQPVQFPLPDNRERLKALDRLLEAKDAAVRALVAK